ncbi:hypothetical protein [Sphingomonas crocodyli]|uniref:Uncharacterized protein n=1 Tax=Sphingomonas crocodyli TaxID=1979270 RepID=A0A437M7V7_9SPHN|nr:hypothetical protein [Sphingomonas crocodyli]RVT93739.1 hypothetical protein EOD43_07695 [Sphingomonas crocodyli]
MSFATESNIKAVRKARRCFGCSVTIEVGEPAVSSVGMSDGDFYANTYHPDCREAEIALNRLRETGWVDDWSCLYDIEWEDWRWLVEEWPAVAARKGITLAKVEETEAEHAAMWQRMRERAK